MGKSRYLAAVIIIAATVFAAPTVPVAQNPIQRNDRDGDGRLSRHEFPGPPHAFQRLDRNGDGFLTLQEMRQARRRQRGGGQFPGRPAPKLAITPSPSWRYVDVHMHLHPVGLDVALGGGRHGGPGIGQGERIDLSSNLASAAEVLVARMDSFGIEKALVVVVPSNKFSPDQDLANMWGAVSSQPNRLFLMAGGATLGSVILSTRPGDVTDVVAENFEAQAKKLLKEGAIGFGEMISYHLCMTQRHSFKYAPADHPLFLRLADVAARAGIVIDLHMEAIETPSPMPKNLQRACDKNPERLFPTIPALERLLRHNRKARIVWQHVGWDNVGQMKPLLLDRLLRKHPNLYMALRVERRVNRVGGGGPMPNRIVDESGRIHPEWLKLITDHQDRLMIGSDEFISPSGKEPRMAASFADTWAMVSRLPPDITTKIGRENAIRVYRLR